MKLYFFIILSIYLMIGCASGVGLQNDANTVESVEVVIDISAVKDIDKIDSFVRHFCDSLKQSFTNTVVTNDPVSDISGRMIIEVSKFSINRVGGLGDKATGYEGRATCFVKVNGAVHEINEYNSEIFDPTVYNESILGLFAPVAVSAARGRAVKTLAVKTAESITGSSEIENAFQAVKIKKSLPCDLVLTLQFSDSKSLQPNSQIDASEDALIIANIANNGKGAAYGVHLSIKSNNNDVTYSFPKNIDILLPNKKRTVLIPIKASPYIQSGKIEFEIIAKEKRGFDSKRYQLEIEKLALSPPHLLIVNYKINDQNTGLSSGNGNGIPENGETIELTPFIKNDGIGKALKVKLAIADINPSIELVRDKVEIKEILPNETATGKLAFTIPRTYYGDRIKLNLKASDVREGVSDGSKTLVLNMVSNRPALAYNYRLIDNNGILENGEEAEIEIIPANNGSMAAKNVTISLDSSDLSLVKTSDTISNVRSNSKFTPLRFAFKVPRTLEKESVDIKVKMTQQDFDGLTSNIHLPVRLVVPEFAISHQVLDPNNNGAIEQGEMVDLMVRVRNTGGLDANDVWLKMAFNKEGVVFQGNPTVSIGRIAAGKDSGPVKFQLIVKRSAQAGALPITFSIDQKDFSSKTLPLALNVVEEQAEVITVASKDQEPTAYAPVVSSLGAGRPPVVVFAAPRPESRVASDYEILSGVLVDDKGVSSYTVTLNGHRLDTGRDITVKSKAGRSQAEEHFRIKIPLQIGKNEIVVTAFDVENLSGSRSLTIYREAQKGEIYAAVIGINQYKSPDVPPLRYARNDAQAFAGYLREYMGIDSNHLFELYDSQATKLNIESLLGGKLSLKAERPEDTVIIYFAGHGAPEPNPSSSDPDNLSKYILAHDTITDPGYMFSTAIDMDRIAEIFKRIRAERVIFIADSCYSGGSGGRTWSSNNRRANISDAFLERISRSGKGRIILASSNAQEVSQESDKLGHGYFTYYLLEGLKGKADTSQDGMIDVDEIYSYINLHVPKATGNTQHPMKKGEAEGRVIIGKVR